MATKRVAARFFQLLSGHAIIAPFLKERWGLADPDICWWCRKGRQSREHLFQECAAWTRESGSVEDGRRGHWGKEQDLGSLQSRKGFGFRVRQAKARPRNTSIRDLLSDGRYTEAVLAFLGATRVEEVQERPYLITKKGMERDLS